MFIFADIWVNFPFTEISTEKKKMKWKYEFKHLN